MNINPANVSSDCPISGILTTHYKEVAKRSEEHERVRQLPDYQAQLSFLRKTVMDMIHSIRLCEITASRWSEFHEKYLLPTYVDDIVEAALTAQLAIENGALNPARRELRYMLEVAVNIAYVDEVRAKDSFDERTSYYRGKGVKKSNVDHVLDLPLRLLGDQKVLFATCVRDAWVRSSNYVHLTKRRVDEKLQLREKGVTLGFETAEMLKQVVADVHEACSIVIVLAFETIGPSFTGDILVDELDEQDEWVFHASGYIAKVDSYFDYKHERQDRLDQLIQRRQKRVLFPISVPYA